MSITRHRTGNSVLKTQLKTNQPFSETKINSSWLPRGMKKYCKPLKWWRRIHGYTERSCCQRTALSVFICATWSVSVSTLGPHNCSLCLSVSPSLMFYVLPSVACWRWIMKKHHTRLFNLTRDINDVMHLFNTLSQYHSPFIVHWHKNT